MKVLVQYFDAYMDSKYQNLLYVDCGFITNSFQFVISIVIIHRILDVKYCTTLCGLRC